MHFIRFGVTLERLDRGYLETVRQWRNSSWVRPYMRYQGFIHPQGQVRWFESLDPERDWYFTAHVQEAPFALFHVKNIDLTQKCGEAGGFVGAPAFIGSPEPAQATIALMDFAFLVLQLDALEAQYHGRLRRVVRFNEQLGYTIFHEESDGFVRARVTAERYFKSAAPFRRAAAALHGARAILAAPEPESSLAPFLARLGASSLADIHLQLR